MQKLGSLFGALLAICLLALPSFAQNDCAKEYAQQIKYIRRAYAEFSKQAKITPDQKQQLQTIRQTTDQQIATLLKAIIDKQRDLIQYLFSPGATQTMAEQRTQEIIQLRSQIALLKLNALLQARNVMTDEQRRQFAAFHKQRIMSLANKYPNCLQPLSNGAMN
jgi:Spy/CpxP family protein refolding chaperone